VRGGREENIPDFPAVEVVLVEVPVEPTDSEVVCRRQDPSSADSIIGTDITDDSNLTRKSNVAEQKAPEKLGERASSDPVPKRVEQQFVAAISVFFPTG
jgi:hypothetical protein